MNQDQINALIEQSIQGHASTRDAMRWLAAQVRSAALDEAADKLKSVMDGFAADTDWAKGYAQAALDIEEGIRALKGTT